MPTALPSKYALKSLHEEIALFDRKLAHLEKYETFPSEKERLAAQAKMSIKRGQLVRAAQAMTDAGFEAEPIALTRLSSEKAEQDFVATTIPPEAMSSGSPESQTLMPQHTGSPLDFRNSIAEFKKRRRNAS